MAMTMVMALVAPAVLAVPASDSRPWEKDVATGTVVLQKRVCAVAPCPPGVLLKTAEGKLIAIGGDFGDDLIAFEGQTVTVKGIHRGMGIYRPGTATSRFLVDEFRPGKATDFFTGTIENRTKCTRGLPPRCIFGAALVVGDEKYPIEATEEQLKELAEIPGATVTLRGSIEVKRCGPGTRCIGSVPSIRLTSDSIAVRGRLQRVRRLVYGYELYYAENASLSVGQGKHDWNALSGETTWVKGKLGSNDEGVFLGATAATAVPDFSLGGSDHGDGNNVARDASTSAPADTSNAPATGVAAGAGMPR